MELQQRGSTVATPCFDSIGSRSQLGDGNKKVGSCSMALDGQLFGTGFCPERHTFSKATKHIAARITAQPPDGFPYAGQRADLISLLVTVNNNTSVLACGQIVDASKISFFFLPAQLCTNNSQLSFLICVNVLSPVENISQLSRFPAHLVKKTKTLRFIYCF